MENQCERLILQDYVFAGGEDVISQALVDKMIYSYRLIPEDTIIDEDATLSTYRISSLLAVELCN